MTEEECIAAVKAHDTRQAAKLITRIESGDTTASSIAARLRNSGHAQIVGITGAPGSGKSTLVDQLISAYRAHAKSVAVLAVDPSSPFSGGAILGDRVRMQRHANDDKVFIRSMSARGAMGGLAAAAGDAIAVLNALGCDIVIVETVGVGQNEIDIVRHANSVVLVDNPNSGDAVQVVKAGVMEIGDIYVVNKADQQGVQRRMQQITEMLKITNTRAGWSPPVLATDALNGKGVEELRAALDAHAAHRRTYAENQRKLT